MKISVVADSLSLPRIDGADVVSWEETWPFVLQELLKQKWKDVVVINFGRRNRTVDTLLGEDYKEFFTFVKPSIVIVQVGVVDGLPRIVSRTERKILNFYFFPNWLREYILDFRKSRRQKIIRKSPMKKVWTKPDKFSFFYGQFIKRVLKDNPECKILSLPILINAQLMDLISPGASSNVSIYNKLIKENCESFAFNVAYVSDKLFDSESFCSDGYHLSPKGNLKLAVYVGDEISKILESN